MQQPEGPAEPCTPVAAVPAELSARTQPVGSAVIPTPPASAVRARFGVVVPSNGAGSSAATKGHFDAQQHQQVRGCRAHSCVQEALQAKSSALERCCAWACGLLLSCNMLERPEWVMQWLACFLACSGRWPSVGIRKFACTWGPVDEAHCMTAELVRPFSQPQLLQLPCTR